MPGESKQGIGYITTKKIEGNDIPQKVQNLVIKDYAQRNGFLIGLSHTEMLVESREKSVEALLEKAGKEVIFYSWRMLKGLEDSSVQKVLREKNFHFALEDITVSDWDQWRKTILEMSAPNSAEDRPLVPFNNLAFTPFELEQSLKSIESVMRSGRILNGSEIDEFEIEFARSLGAKHALGCSSGTGSLVLALLSCGIGPGDEVIVPSISWISTAHAVSFIGARPVFCDVNDNMGMSFASLKECGTQKTKAVICVHFLGKICGEIQEIVSFCRRQGYYLIEDSSQAFGAEMNGVKAGSFGDISCFSLNPMKPLAAAGEAGAIASNNQAIMTKAQELRYCGMADKNRCVRSSLNFRMDALQAAILLTRLKVFSEKSSWLRELHLEYEKSLEGKIEFLQEEENERLAYYGFTVFSSNRDGLINYLASSGVESKVQHSPPIPLQPMYKDSPSQFKNALVRSDKVLSLPLYANMRKKEVSYVVSKVLEFSK